MVICIFPFVPNFRFRIKHHPRMSQHSRWRESGLFSRWRCFPGKLQCSLPTFHKKACFSESCHVSLQQKCLERACCWSPLNETNVPWCFFSKNHGYSVVSENKPDSTREFSLSRDVAVIKHYDVSLCHN